jgi:hypothetical protein
MKRIMLCAAVLASAGAGAGEKVDDGCRLKYMLDKGCPYIAYEEQACRGLIVVKGYCFKDMCKEGDPPKVVLRNSVEACTVAPPAGG